MGKRGSAGVVLAAGLLMFGTATACGARHALAPPCPMPSAPWGDADSVELKVADQGFSQVGPWPAKVSMGAIVENNGTRVAYRTRVAFRAVDSRGGDVVSAASRAFLVQEVPLIRPGQRVAVGTSVFARNSRVAKIVVAAEASRRIDPSGFADISARVTTGRAGRADDGSTALDYQVTSGYCGDLISRGVSVVFRDQAGHIVGGSLSNAPESAGCLPGTSVQRVLAAEKSVPERADLDRTEISQYCDLARATVGTAPGTPVN
jgi:hypothetical protein